MESFLEDLNPSQLEAVKHIDGALLILAGAGSGKTKTITTRLAYLLSLGIEPSSTLTLTFTNKAAAEMRNRAMSMIDNRNSTPPMLVTFHKFGLLFLKLYIYKLNRKNSFIIIDSDDKKRIIKNISNDLAIPFVAKEISNYKNNFITPEEAYALAKDSTYKKTALIYKEYKEYLINNNLVDFDDLLLLTYQILDEDEELAKEISQKYQYIMVDEYQDTNEIQLKILKKLCTTHNNICVVGDDDQSIYGFRGANIKNILEFDKEFNATTIKLEENYRSTKEILDIANSLIAYNKNRHDKKLISVRGKGKDVTFLDNYNENSEAEFIAKKIKNLISTGVNPNDVAIIYRINVLSRSIEEGLRKENVNYKLVGGIKFYEREEIKDVISYFRLIINYKDDYSFKRIVNKPRRGIGKASLDKIENTKGNISFMEFIKTDDLSFLSKKASNSLKQFLDIIDSMNKNDIENIIENLETKIELSNFYKDEDKVRNLNEFYALLREYSEKNINLEDILNDLSLKSDADDIENQSINVMSIHASKGLEFKYLFVIGLEEGFFPIDNSDIEEERRLAYVAFTRAKNELFISSAKSRFIRGSRSFVEKSRFLNEAGIISSKPIIEEKKKITKKDLVKHKVFGIGRVIGSTKSGNYYKLKIDFGGNIREILSNFVEKI